MSDVVIWHNSRCRKSREGLKYLQDKGIEPVIFQYLKEPIDPQVLRTIIKQSGQPVEVFIRKKEAEFKSLGLKDVEMTVEKFAEIVVDHPKLLERPIIVNGNKAILGRPAEEIGKIL